MSESNNSEYTYVDGEMYVCRNVRMKVDHQL